MNDNEDKFSVLELMKLPPEERDRLIALAFEAAAEEDFEIFEAYSEEDMDAVWTEMSEGDTLRD